MGSSLGAEILRSHKQPLILQASTLDIWKLSATLKPGVFYGLKLIRALKVRTSGHGGLGFETLGYIYLFSFWHLPELVS